MNMGNGINRRYSRSQGRILGLFKKMGQSQPLFRLFSPFSQSNNNYNIGFSFNFNNINGRKRRWFAWDSNPGREDGRRRRNHGHILSFDEMSSIQMSSTAANRFLGEIDLIKCSYTYLSFKTFLLLLLPLVRRMDDLLCPGIGAALKWMTSDK